MGKKDRITAVKFCNGDCNHCAAINNRQVSLLMNTLLHIYGDDIEEIVHDCGCTTISDVFHEDLDCIFVGHVSSDDW